MPRESDNTKGEGWRFSGFVLPTTTPVPDQFFDELLYHLEPSETVVLLYIFRRTFGFKKSSDNISLRQLVEGITTRDGRVLDRGTGLSKATVARALAGLEAKPVIVRLRRRSVAKGDEPTTYQLNIPGLPQELDARQGERTELPVSQNETPPLSRFETGRVTKRDTQQTVRQERVKEDGAVGALTDCGLPESVPGSVRA